MSAICDAHKKNVGVELLYNLGEDRKSGSWRSDQLEKRCGRENQHPEKLGPLAPGWAAQENGERNADGHKSGGQYVAVLFGLQLPLTHNPFNKVRGIFF